MNLDELKELIALLKETDITDVQIEKEGVRVRLKRERYLSAFEPPRISVHEQRIDHAAPRLDIPNVVEEDTQRLVTITAPLVGTFYRSSSPEAPPFVESGARVRKGQVLCIVEAMKLMNEIESETDGVIVRVLVENGQAVEYGEPLFLIDPA
jgi:acetyl-CoA carboxylase biotin carboxyl carrier protein